MPSLRDRRSWWVRSVAFDPPWPAADAVLIWNPIAAARCIEHVPASVPIVCDLLDDWTHHEAFAGFTRDVREAYARVFEYATHVTANSEGTLDLAHRFGRDDAILLPNGCDPDRFSTDVVPHDTFTVGYGGKIGHRIDVPIVRAAAKRFPGWRFEFLGPILTRTTKTRLRDLPNVHFKGDVRYPDYPSMMCGWDVAWVPHRTGDGEVGGDVMKIYEYRAAGLPVVIPKIIGWQRALPRVRVAETEEFGDVLSEIAENGKPMGVPRDHYKTPIEHTWLFKARAIAGLMRLT